MEREEEERRRDLRKEKEKGGGREWGKGEWEEGRKGGR